MPRTFYASDRPRTTTSSSRPYLPYCLQTEADAPRLQGFWNRRLRVGAHDAVVRRKTFGEVHAVDMGPAGDDRPARVNRLVAA